MIVHTFCKKNNKFILCILNNKGYTIPVGSIYMRNNLKLNDEKINYLLDNFKIKKIFLKPTINGHNYCGNYFTSENMEDMTKFCDYVNSLVVLNKMEKV